MESIGEKIVDLVFEGELERALRLFSKNQIESDYDNGTRSYLGTHEVLCKAAKIENNKQVYLRSFELVIKNYNRVEFFETAQGPMRGVYYDITIPELPFDWYIDATEIAVKNVQNINYPDYAIRDILNYLKFKDTEKYFIYARKFLSKYKYHGDLAEAFYKFGYYKDSTTMYLKEGGKLYNVEEKYRLLLSLEKTNKGNKKQDLSKDLIEDGKKDIDLSKEEFETIQQEYDISNWQYLISCFKDFNFDELLVSLYIENGEKDKANEIIEKWHDYQFDDSFVEKFNKSLEKEYNGSFINYPSFYFSYWFKIYYDLAIEHDLPVKSSLQKTYSLLKSGLEKHPPYYDSESEKTVTLISQFKYIIATNSFNSYDITEYIDNQENEYGSSRGVVNTYRIDFYIATEDIYNAIEYYKNLENKFGLKWLKILGGYGGYELQYYAYFHLKQNNIEKAAKILNLFDSYVYKLATSKLYFLASNNDKALEILEEVAKTYKHTSQDLKRLIYMYFFHGFHDKAKQIADEYEYPELIASLYEHSGMYEEVEETLNNDIEDALFNFEDLPPLPDLPTNDNSSMTEPKFKLCQNCQTQNESDANFCKNCGSRFELLCYNCGKAVSKEDKFCSSCGYKL